ncbi:CoA transferase [Polycyclovorans algicola]|uniref:CoA transferase n=1 Tax=Polycyclovorans algicola TaxID=616992 RepID=UPI00069499A7|nr:CoA transferase [Polycyclovorans algicola]
MTAGLIPQRAEQHHAEAGLAGRYVSVLLNDLGRSEHDACIAVPEHPAAAWARSGLMALTGNHDPALCIAPIVSAAQGALAALKSVAPNTAGLDEIDAALLLGERAALTGSTRAGATSPGGACHLLATADDWLAVNLARDDDWALLPAWLEIDACPDLATLAAELTRRPSALLIERAGWLGLAVARDQAPQAAAWCTVHSGADWRGTTTMPARAPRVLDLSSLWAGPLCSHLLQRLGAEVIKVEGWQRPDGARRGNADFFNLLHAGKRCVALDWGTPTGTAQLRALLASADIVIEGSRPRALQQLGIEAEAWVAERPHRTWISLTGYGRCGPDAERVAFGDDATVAAGLSHLMHDTTGQRLMVGDALADPLTGLHAALAAWASWCDGGGRLVGLSLVDVTRHAACFELPESTAGRRARHADWQAWLHRHGVIAQPPRARLPVARAASLGADSAQILDGLAPC